MRRFSIHWLVTALFLINLLSIGALFAQTPLSDSTSATGMEGTMEMGGEAPTGEAEEAPQLEENAFANAGQFKLDVTSIVMILLANLIIAVGIERWWALHKSHGNNAELVKILTDALAKDPQSVDSLAETVREKKFGLSGRVAAITLKGWQYGEDTMKEYATTSLTAEKRGLEKRLVILSTLGNNTPFIGLLGTVLGIMHAFKDLALQGDGGPAVVMVGISQALVATAMGLGVAIPCVIAYNLLARAVKDRISSAEEIVSLIAAIRLSVRGGNHMHHLPENSYARVH